MPASFRLNYAAAAIIGGLAVLPAAAFATPTPGNYSGTIEDGSSINFTVTEDSTVSPHTFTITAFGFNFKDTCKGGSTFSSGWGLGANSELVNGKATYISNFAFLYAKATIKVSGNTASGTILNKSPTFKPHNGASPTQALFCSSPSQTWTASLVPPAVTAPQAPVAAMLYAPRTAK